MSTLFASHPSPAILDLGPTMPALGTWSLATLDLEPIPPPRDERRQSAPWLDGAADGPRPLRPSCCRSPPPARRLLPRPAEPPLRSRARSSCARPRPPTRRSG